MWPHHQYNYKGLLKVHCNGVGVRIGRRMQILRWTRVCCFATDWDAGCTNSVCGGDEDLLFPVEGGGRDANWPEGGRGAIVEGGGGSGGGTASSSCSPQHLFVFYQDDDAEVNVLIPPLIYHNDHRVVYVDDDEDGWDVDLVSSRGEIDASLICPDLLLSCHCQAADPDKILGCWPNLTWSYVTRSTSSWWWPW